MRTLIGALALLCAGSVNAYPVRVDAANFTAHVPAGSSDSFAEPGFPEPNIQKPATSTNQVVDFSVDFTDPSAAHFYNVECLGIRCGTQRPQRGTMRSHRPATR